MSDLPQIDWDEKDKRDAAIHEAGHIVVGAIRDGLVMGAYLHRSKSTDVIGDRAWLGASHGIGLRQNQSAAMSVAGCVAELLDDDPLITADDAREEVELGDGLSDTDRRGYPTEYAEQLQAFEEALATLRGNREFFEWVVSQLMDEDGNYVTNGMVEDYLQSRKA